MPPVAVCKRCGAVYWGWALLEMHVVECRECGARLDVELQPCRPDQCRKEVVAAVAQDAVHPHSDKA